MRIRRTFLVLAAALVAIVAVGCGSQKTEAATQSPAPAAPAAAPAPTPSPEAEPAAAPAAEAPPTTTSSGGTLSEIAPGVMNFKPETPAKDPAERAKRLADLKAQWLKEARAEKSEPGSTQWALTGTTIVGYGPEGVNSFIDVIADPNEDPFVKVLAVDSLKGLVNPSMCERLKSLFAPEHDGTTRACAVHVYGTIGADEVVPVLRGLVKDPETRVRFAAMRGLAMHGGPEDRQLFLDLYKNPATLPLEREAIARLVGEEGDEAKIRQLVPLYCLIVQDFEIGMTYRQMAIAALGRSGDPAGIPALKVTAEKDTDAYVREVAASAINVIEQANAQAKPEAAKAAPTQ